MKNKKIIIFIIIIACSIIAFYSMSNVVTPYVSFKEAVKSGAYVQVIGKLDNSIPVKHEEGFFEFSLEDSDGAKLHFIHSGTKPANFEHADQIVVQGVYNSEKKIFVADKLLVKCPSKYEKKAT